MKIRIMRSWFITRRFNEIINNHKTVCIPKADAKPMPLPGENCRTNEAFTWKVRFGEHCNKYKFEINYPVVPKPEILAT